MILKQFYHNVGKGCEGGERQITVKFGFSGYYQAKKTLMNVFRRSANFANFGLFQSTYKL